MPATPPARVQFVVSGKCITLLLIAGVLLVAGSLWYFQEQHVQQRFHIPPYFTNHGSTVVRTCNHCLDLDKLKPQADWELGGVEEIPASEQRWFLAVEDPPLPVEVAGVLMLPVHPAVSANPALGFDRTQALLVLFQGLRRMPDLVQPAPPPVPAEPPAPSPPPTDRPGTAQFLGEWKNEDPETRSVTRISVTDEQGKLVVHAWGKCFPTDCDWSEAEATATGQELSVFWDQKFATRRWELSLESDGRLKVSEHSHYSDARGDRDETSYFVRGAEGQR